MASGDLASASDVYQIEANKKKSSCFGKKWEEPGTFFKSGFFRKRRQVKRKKKKHTCCGRQNPSDWQQTDDRFYMQRRKIQSSRRSTEEGSWKTPADFKTSYEATDSVVPVRERACRSAE